MFFSKLSWHPVVPHGIMPCIWFSGFLRLFPRCLTTLSPRVKVFLVSTCKWNILRVPVSVWPSSMSIIKISFTLRCYLGNDKNMCYALWCRGFIDEIQWSPIDFLGVEVWSSRWPWCRCTLILWTFLDKVLGTTTFPTLHDLSIWAFGIGCPTFAFSC